MHRIDQYGRASVLRRYSLGLVSVRWFLGPRAGLDLLQKTLYNDDHGCRLCSFVNYVKLSYVVALFL